MSAIETFEKLLADGKDSALLRYGLGDAYFKLGEFDKASLHLQSAVRQDPEYSAAWKLLGKSLSETGRLEEAAGAFENGISVATRKGDVQAAKEMRVFLKRAQKARG